MQVSSVWLSSSVAVSLNPQPSTHPHVGTQSTNSTSFFSIKEITMSTKGLKRFTVKAKRSMSGLNPFCDGYESS
ncbi:hypothetical protein JI435_402510 [Parastagonospora nodorum SN15]|uniref:Uncharacterized protein n=1 Tax=Phaeosphaeria nodorum (strain SN15 / ATCC MYA-4574 / FGSC 10173) TaxID=321614 RepID=A0A7U2ET23_PHANO|nr:hypothetical protein JI435_402510 [Parastagonospora nodorum SN15]